MKTILFVLCTCIFAFGLLGLGGWKSKDNPITKIMEMEIFDIYGIHDEGEFDVLEDDEKASGSLETSLHAANENKNGDEHSTVTHGLSLTFAHDDTVKPKHFDVSLDSIPPRAVGEEWNAHALPFLTNEGYHYPGYITAGETRVRKGLEKVYQKLCEAYTEMDNAVKYTFLMGSVFGTIVTLAISFLNQICRYYKETNEWCPKPAASETTLSTYTSGSIRVSDSVSSSSDVHEV